MRYDTANAEQSWQARLVRWWRSWSTPRSGELDALRPEEVNAIARDVGATSGELRALAGKWPEAADLLDRRMTTLGLEKDDVKHEHPAVTRDLEKLCSLCGAKSECEHDLIVHPVDPAWRHYCPNATTLMELVEEKQDKNESAGGASRQDRH